MGLDGGTYITRSDVLRGQCWDLNKADNSRSTRGGSVRGTHKKAKLDPKASRQLKWTTCALSEQPLKAPLVADRLGNLYNKTAILEFLLGRGSHFADATAEHRYVNQLNAAAGGLDHLQSRRDVFAVHLENMQPPATPDTQADLAEDIYRCPITDLPCISHPFSALTTCGHVFSDRALSQAAAAEEAETCAVCSRPYDATCVVPLNGDPERMEELRSLLPTLRGSGKRRKSSLALSLENRDVKAASVETLPSFETQKRLRAA